MNYMYMYTVPAIDYLSVCTCKYVCLFLCVCLSVQSCDVSLSLISWCRLTSVHWRPASAFLSVSYNVFPLVSKTSLTHTSPSLSCTLCSPLTLVTGGKRRQLHTKMTLPKKISELDVECKDMRRLLFNMRKCNKSDAIHVSSCSPELCIVSYCCSSSSSSSASFSGNIGDGLSKNTIRKI